MYLLQIVICVLSLWENAKSGSKVMFLPLMSQSHDLFLWICCVRPYCVNMHNSRSCERIISAVPAVDNNHNTWTTHTKKFHANWCECMCAHTQQHQSSHCRAYPYCLATAYNTWWIINAKSQQLHHNALLFEERNCGWCRSFFVSRIRKNLLNAMVNHQWW